MGRNKIVDAAEREELYEQESLEQEVDGEEGHYALEELTDEDVTSQIQRLDQTSRARVEASRKRGRAPRQGHSVHETPAKKDARARSPVRERPVTWTPSDALYAPPPNPGMEQRWIRVRLGEKDDPSNIAKKLSAREGWKPRSLEDLTEDYNVPTMSFGRLGTVIGVSDLILCERDERIGMARRRYFQSKLARQMASADKRHIRQVEQEGHEIEGGAREDMPVTVGRGTRRRPEAQGDE